jgi:hypothetical protein
MKEDLAAVNVTRSYTLAGTNIAIFTFMLFFLYPRFESDRINPVLFQATLIAMGIATFSLVFATLQSNHWSPNFKHSSQPFGVIGVTLPISNKCEQQFILKSS